MSKHEDRGRAPRRIPILNIPGNSDSLSAIVHDLGYAAPDPNAQLAALLAMPRDQLHSATLVLTYLLTEPALLERVLDVVIAVLDTKDGNTDLEPSNDLEDVADDTEQDDSDREPDDEGDDDPDREDDDLAEDDDPLEPDNAQGWGSNFNVGVTPPSAMVRRLPDEHSSGAETERLLRCGTQGP